MINFGLRLRNLRTQRNLTQKQLANLLHIQDSIISAYENGARYPSLDVLISLTAVFHVTADYLLGIEQQITVDVSGLTDSQIQVVESIAAEFRKSNSQKKEGVIYK